MRMRFGVARRVWGWFAVELRIDREEFLMGLAVGEQSWMRRS